MASTSRDSTFLISPLKLTAAARRGNEEAMNELLTHHSNLNVNEVGDDDEVLHIAIRLNQDLGVAKVLLGYPKIDVNRPDRSGQTLLHIASRQDYRSHFVKLLLRRSDIEVNATTKNFCLTPLHIAARFACPKNLELLFKAEKPVTIDAQTDDGLTALHLVAEGGREHRYHWRRQEDRCNVVQMLFEEEKQRTSSKLACNLNRTDVLNRFPIHYGVEGESVEVVKALLKWENTKINAQDIYGLTPLHLAIRSTADNRKEMVDLLLGTNDIDVNIMKSVMPSSTGTQQLKFQESEEDWGDRQLYRLFPFQRLKQGTGNNQTALHFAALKGSVEIVDLLLRRPEIKISIQDDKGFTPLHFAAQQRHVGVVERFLQLPPYRHRLLDQAANKLLHDASEGGDAEPEELIEPGTTEVNINWKNNDGNTPLHLASEEGHDEVVQLLLENVRKSDLYASNGDENTPLHLAAESGHVKVVKLLLKSVALELNVNEEHDDGNNARQRDLTLHLNEQTCHGNTPMHLASMNGHVEVVEVLLGLFGCEDTYWMLNRKNGRSNTPLHLATEGGHVKVVNLFLEQHCVDFDRKGKNTVQKQGTKLNLNVKNDDGDTPLHLAFKEGHEDVVDAMLSSKCANQLALNAKNNRRNTPLHLATKNGQVAVVSKTLLEGALYKFNLNAKNENGHTPLHFAVRRCHLDVVKALCDTKQGLRANLEDGRGKTCLQYAKHQEDDDPKFEDIAKLLMERSDVKDFLERQYRDRQVFIDAANALLVGGALIAGITFASWLQPPLGYITYYQFAQSSPGTPPNTFETFAALELHYSLRLFWVFNTLSFFFAIATVISGAKAAFPDLDTVFIVDALRTVRRELLWTSTLLVCAVVTVLGSFVCAGFAILPPIQRDVRNMKISVIIGVLICTWTIVKFLIKLYKTMAKVIKKYGATSTNQQRREENLWAWLLQCVRFMGRRQIGGDDEMEEVTPTRLNTKTKSDLLKVATSEDYLQCVKYIGEGVSDLDVGAIQGNSPPRRPQETLYYFEIIVKSCGVRGYIGIGFTDEGFKNNRQPGWEPNSYGYHGDDGGLFHGLDCEAHQKDFRPTFSTGDAVGAGINYMKKQIFFTKNGKLVGCINNEVTEILYPTIGLHRYGEKVEVNFGQKEYAYDLKLLNATS